MLVSFSRDPSNIVSHVIVQKATMLIVIVFDMRPLPFLVLISGVIYHFFSSFNI